MSAASASAGRPAAAAIVALLAGVAAWLLHWQGGWPAWRDPGAARLAAAALVGLAYAGLCGAIAHAHRRRRAGRADAGTAAPDADAVLVAHASQTGFAEQLAERSAEALRGAGVPVRVAALGALDAQALARTRRALFVVSTTGEGDAPDGAAPFVQHVLAGDDAAPALAGLRYGVLALGDSTYRNFCAFGRRLDAWLRHRQAQPLFDAVEVDDGDEGALRHWQHHLGLLAGDADLPDWSPPRYGRWRLVERRLTNPDSLGEPCFHLALRPCEGALPDWRAGDIAEIGPRHAAGEVDAQLRTWSLDGEAVVDAGDGPEPLRAVLARSRWPGAGAPASPQALAAQLQPLPHREYSIASLPADGALHLLVRRLRRADGRLGLASAWLTRDARVGDEIALRIRTNANFHAPLDDRPLILVGNGTGIAGLRALLKARIAAGRARNWLVFGERQAARDFHYRDDVEAWRAQGWIARLDLAFSRDAEADGAGPAAPGGRTYVQHRLAAAAAELRAWIADGAAVYVCGSLDGMAPAVHAALVDVLGRDAVERLLAEGRYRRDVY